MADGPCGWEPITACCTGWANLDPGSQDQALAAATEIVWRLSGMQFGACEITLRPCAQECLPSTYSQSFVTGYGSFSPGGVRPLIRFGEWINIGCGCGTKCDCSGADKLWIPPPVAGVVEVLIDGVVFADWRVSSGHLIRTDGGQWPTCQAMDADTTEPGTWAVTYLHGEPVPVSGNLAAGVLACELAKSCAGLKCRLPARVTDVTREGITMSMLDPQDFLSQGLTGITEVDQFLRSVNPNRLASASQVWSPDLPEFWQDQP